MFYTVCKKCSIQQRSKFRNSVTEDQKICINIAHMYAYINVCIQKLLGTSGCHNINVVVVDTFEMLVAVFDQYQYRSEPVLVQTSRKISPTYSICFRHHEIVTNIPLTVTDILKRNKFLGKPLRRLLQRKTSKSIFILRRSCSISNFTKFHPSASSSPSLKETSLQQRTRLWKGHLAERSFKLSS